MSNEVSQELGVLLDYLHHNRGFDFSSYKTNSLMRRLQKRMKTVNIESYTDYIDYLEVHPDEFSLLFNTILINVTNFFRDKPAWDFLAAEILPSILEKKKNGEPVRVWSTGCASGEEAYTLAMLLAEAIGEEDFLQRVKIFATDVDDEALNKARQAIFTERDVESMPPQLLEKYFVRSGSGFNFKKVLRHNLIFGRNDLIQDAPISRIDLLLCRNTLMYFNTEAQARILSRFHFALKEEGYLFLGKAETLLAHYNTFTPVSLEMRIFRKVPRLPVRDRVPLPGDTSEEEGINHPLSIIRIRDMLFDNSPVAQVLMDMGDRLLLANEEARQLLGITMNDLGRPFFELDIPYRPVELRPSIQRANTARIPILIKDVLWSQKGGANRFFDIRIQPLTEDGNLVLGTSIVFNEMTRYKQLQQEVEITHHELETAMEELQSTNEELETTNEELQSTVEELQSTNEELQATNQELETINEELQSTNEELQATNDELESTNDELHKRSNELGEVNLFLESILTSLPTAIAIMDTDFRVQSWNRNAEAMWGLSVNDVLGRSFLGLDIGLPVEILKRPFLACLAGQAEWQEAFLEARNQHGKDILCRVTTVPLQSKDKVTRGLITLMDEIDSKQGDFGHERKHQENNSKENT